MTTGSPVNLRDRPVVAGERAEVDSLGYEALVAARAAQDPAWLGALREAAYARFRELGIPTVRSEDWRYTNTAPLTRATHAPAPAVAAPVAEPLTAFAGPVLAVRLDNGRVTDRPSDLPEGLVIRNLAESDDISADLLRPDDHGLMALNAALLEDALVIEVARGARIAAPLVIDHVSHAADEQAVHSRVILRLQEGASITVFERYRGRDEAAHWVNPVRRFSVGENARLRLVTLVDENPRAMHTGVVALDVARDGNAKSWVLVDGGRTARHEARVHFAGPNASVAMKGATLAAASQNLAIYTAVDHAVPHCRSDQMFRSVVDQGGASAFQGRVLVREGAQKTDANQSSRNLLLDRNAEANAKPELEIYADDVKCSHGATVGELDADMLFYLEARGVPRHEARAMLVEAFVAGVLEDAPELADQLLARVSRWMGERGEKL